MAPLILLTAAVMAVIVLLFGFTGCSLLVQPADEPEFKEAFEAAFTDLQQRRSRTIVLKIETSKLFASGGRVRITLEPPATGELTAS